MFLTEKRVYQIIERVAERTNGIIEPCLIDELSKCLDEEVILDFCFENKIIIDTEEPRANKGKIKYNISHSREMMLWLQCKNDDPRYETQKNEAINQLLMMYQPKCDAAMHQLFKGNKWIEVEDACQIAWTACWKILINDRFPLHTAGSLDNLMLYQIKKVTMNIYKDTYVDGINHHTPKDKITDQIVKYVEYLDECDYESNPYSAVKNDNDIVTEKQTKNGYHESDVENNAILWTVIDSLPSDDRDILMMSSKGITQEEIAKMKGCSQVSIHKRLKKIAEQLQEEVIF